MTPAQREAAIERMAVVLLRAYDSEFDAAHLTPANFRDDAADCLDALTEEFVVLHRDDVTEETRCTTEGRHSECRDRSARLVTRWKPSGKL